MRSRPSCPPSALCRYMAVLLAVFIAIPVFSAGEQKGPTSWRAMPYLKPYQLRKLIANSQLVAKTTVIQHWPRSIDKETHPPTEHPAHTNLKIDKVFRGSFHPGQTIDLFCICSPETASTVLTPGQEVIVFANLDEKSGLWVPSGFDYSIYFLDYSDWLDQQISERTSKH